MRRLKHPWKDECPYSASLSSEHLSNRRLHSAALNSAALRNESQVLRRKYGVSSESASGAPPKYIAEKLGTDQGFFGSCDMV